MNNRVFVLKMAGNHHFSETVERDLRLREVVILMIVFLGVLVHLIDKELKFLYIAHQFSIK